MKLTQALLPLLIAGCGAPEFTWPDTRTVLTPDSGVDDPQPIDVVAQARAGGHALHPLGAKARAVEVLEVLDVDELRLRTDRGVEHVRVMGMAGDDPRLPDDVRTALRGRLIDAARKWLTAPAGRVYERSPAHFGPGGAVVGPSFTATDGLRLVTLSRAHPADGTDLVDYVETALQRGWGYAQHPYGDYLAMDPRWAFVGEPVFGKQIRSARVARREFEAEAKELATLTPEALQAIGGEILEEVAAWLQWEPASPVKFEPLSLDDARPVYRAAIERYRARTGGSLQKLAERMRNASGDSEGARSTTFVIDTTPIEEGVDLRLANDHGFSPAGPTIFVLRKAELSRPMLEQVLVHEIMHQYQEEVVFSEDEFPPIHLPPGLVEAHAELLAAQFRRDRRPGYKSEIPIAYHDSMRRLLGLVQASGLSANDVVRKFAEGEWDNEPWSGASRAEFGFQELMFRQTRVTNLDGLDFNAHQATDASGPRVRIQNKHDLLFRGQFHGRWLVADEGDRTPIRVLEGPPFNLTLEPGRWVEVLVADLPPFSPGPDGLPPRVVGLFSRSGP